ncbi:MAG: molecular chaperone DnaJ [Alphaproteobacteria bacterium]|nr:molecular chaperone DnaJ [Alphaproteobacteria bacterium]
MPRDYYEVLGIERSATKVEIKKAYRKLALQFHPDRNQGDAEAEVAFKEASEAYEVLSDDEKRGVYDQFGHDGLKGRGFDPGYTDFSDLFRDIFGGAFGGFGGGGGGQRVRRGADLEAHLEVDFMEAAHGITKELEVPRRVHCGTCDGKGTKPGASRTGCSMCGGRGQVAQQHGFMRIATTCPQCRGQGTVLRPEDRCPDCHGSGLQRETSSLEVKVPAGIDHGIRLRYTGKGEAGDPGAPPGDLFVVIHVKPHELFKREGQDTFVQIGVPYPTMVLGGTIRIPTVHGEESLDIPAGTPSGKVFDLPRQGLEDPRGHRGRGTHHVMTVVEVPRKVSGEERELLEQLAEIHGEKVGEKGIWSKLFGT